MNDLLSPILTVMEDEIDTFWCFKGLMDIKAENFHKDQIGMHSQLSKLDKLLRIVDSELACFLNSQGADNMFFCYRWLLVLFKREFPYRDVFRMWEAFFACQDTSSCSSSPSSLPQEFHLFFALALMMEYRQQIMVEEGFDGVLKFVATLPSSTTLDAKQFLTNATLLYQQFDKMTDNLVKTHIFYS